MTFSQLHKLNIAMLLGIVELKELASSKIFSKKKYYIEYTEILKLLMGTSQSALLLLFFFFLHSNDLTFAAVLIRTSKSKSSQEVPLVG